jgi:Leucine-rich repeat (LRR) protein
MKLQRIWCSSNRVERLPPLKHLAALKQLRCGENRLREIPEVPETVHLLNCGDNLLKTLPTLPKNMVELLTEGNLAYLGYINY